MIAPSTDFPNWARTVRSWAATSKYYYLKHPGIFAKTTHNGRTFYSRYERIDRPLSDAELQNHLHHRQTIALPLSYEEEGVAVLFYYDADAPERFVHLFDLLMQTHSITDYHMLAGDHPSTRLAIIPRDRQEITSLHQWGRTLSQQLESTLPKSWKILPDPSLPDESNLLPIPFSMYYDW